MPTHGSLTKAGKVRSQTPRTPSGTKRGFSPKVRNHRNYQRMLSGRRDFSRRGRRRRR